MTDKKACRDGYGKALVELGRNKKIVALSADLAPSVRMECFKKYYPNRYFDVGVAEQNLVTVASGLSHVGKIPFVSSFGMFSPGRNWEQIRTTICYNNANVKIVSTHSGLNVGEDGATHQALEDIAIMRCIPNMVVIQPIDYEQTKKATKAIANYKGPCYMRLGRYKSEEITTSKTNFKIGRAQKLRDGKKACIIGCGPILIEALKVADELKNIRVLNMHTIKPIDKNAIIKTAKECKKIITIEDHQTMGGLGSAVAEVVAENYPCKVHRIGVQDKFGESGTAEQLFKKYKITKEKIKSLLK